MSDPGLVRLAGSVVMAGFRGRSAAPGTAIRAQVGELGLGGVLLFDRDLLTGQAGRNLADPEQIRRLCRDLDEASEGRLLVAVDQEGGAVARLHPRNGFSAHPSAAETGAQGPEATRRAASEIARELAETGIRVNFAPVVDLALDPSNPVLAARGRCFSADAAVVIDHARAFVEAHRDRGIACTLKHFPGHGGAAADSHAGPVDITGTHSPEEIVPYRALIREGCAPMVMCGHLLHRSRDAHRPASLSRSWIEGTLRGELGFEGVVVTDDLDMGALAGMELADRVVDAVAAGADLVVVGNQLTYDAERPRAVVEAIVAAVRAGRISEESLARSRDRLARLRGSSRP